MEQLTLSVDCGGLGIKASVLDSAGTMRIPAVRIPTPYPLSPQRLVETIADLAKTGKYNLGIDIDKVRGRIDVKERKRFEC